VALFILLLILGIVLWIQNDQTAKIRSAYLDGYADAENKRPKRYEDGVTEEGSAGVVGDYNQTAYLETPYVESPADELQYTEEILPPLAPEKKELTEAERERIVLRNLNVVLYVASFLFVAAAAALMAAAVAPVVRLTGLIVVVGLFYIGGLVLYLKFPRVRPAAIAFVGTGLAILPFVGVALPILGQVSAADAWLIVSGFGLLAYVVAAIILQSQVISYVAMAFVLSFASSAVASAQLPILWYYVVLLVISNLAYVVAFIRPKWLPKVFTQPLQTTGAILTPILLIGSLATGLDGSLRSFQIVFGLAGLQYVFSWLLTRRHVYEVAARGIFHIFALLVIGDALNLMSVSEFGIVWLLPLLLQALYSYVRCRRPSAHRSIEAVWYGSILFGILAGMVLWTVDAAASELYALSLLSMMIVGGMAWRSLKNVYWGLVSFILAVPFIMVIARDVLPTVIDWQWVGLALLILSFAVLWWRSVTASTERSSLLVQRIVWLLYVACAIFIAISIGDAAASMLLFVVAAGSTAASYVEKQILLETIAAPVLVAAILYGSYAAPIGHEWKVWTGILVATITLAVAAYVHHRRGESDRRDSVAVAALAVSTLLALVMFDGTELVRRITVGVLLTVSGALLVLRTRLASVSLAIKWVAITGYFLLAILALLVAITLSTGWIAATCAALAVIFWVGSYKEKQPVLMAVGNIAIILAGMALWRILDTQAIIDITYLAWAVAVLIYGLYLLAAHANDQPRRHIQLGFTLLVLISTAILFAGYDAFWLLLAASVVLVISSYHERQDEVEVAGAIAAGLAITYGVYASNVANEWKFWLCVVVSTTIFVVASLMHHRRGEPARRDAMAATAFATVSLLVLSALNANEAVRQASAGMLPALALIGFGLRQVLANVSETLRSVTIGAYFTWAAFAVAVAMTLSAGWVALSAGVLALILWLGSYREVRPWLMLGGNAAIVVAAVALWGSLEASVDWLIAGVAWISAAVIYGLYWLAVNQGDRLRQQMQLGTVVFLLGIPALFFFQEMNYVYVLSAAGSIIAIAAALIIDGYRMKNAVMIEVAMYVATIGLQRMVSIIIPDVSFIVYVHWWAITISLVAWGLRLRGVVRYQLSIAMITIFVGAYALGVGGGYALLFLIEHLALLIFGALYGARWALWWGAAAAGLAIMYFLREYVYVWLGLFGLVLIAIVIWRLVKTDQKPGV